jgi:hypothetical protein
LGLYIYIWEITWEEGKQRVTDLHTVSILEMSKAINEVTV